MRSLGYCLNMLSHLCVCFLAYVRNIGKHWRGWNNQVRRVMRAALVSWKHIAITVVGGNSELANGYITYWNNLQSLMNLMQKRFVVTSWFHWNQTNGALSPNCWPMFSGSPRMYVHTEHIHTRTLQTSKLHANQSVGPKNSPKKTRFRAHPFCSHRRRRTTNRRCVHLIRQHTTSKHKCLTCALQN